MRVFIVTCCLMLQFYTKTMAQTQPSPMPKSLKVTTREVAPFVEKRDGRLTGFSIELWNAIAEQLRVTSQFQMKGNVRELLKSVQTGEADLAVAAISVTSERNRHVDFSQPIYDAGLQILVKGQASAPSLLDGFTALLRSPIMGQFLIAVAIVILVPSHLLWFLERRSEEGIIRHKSYFPGIFEAFWWTVSCLATQAEEMPKTVWARILAVIWMFFAVIFIAYVTAALTANLTLQTLRGEIRGPDDLPGKTVATVGGSTAEAYLREQKIRIRPFPTIKEAIDALEKGQAAAVVYDSPILLYHTANEGKGQIAVVGPVFRRESYAIAFPNGSKLRKPVESVLLRLKENGDYDQLREKWFGQANSE